MRGSGLSSAEAGGFRRVLAAEVVSNFGSMLTRLVIPWIATLTLGVSPLGMGILVVADVAAAAAGALLLGALIDRLPTRRVMVIADAARALLFVAVAHAAWSGQLTLPWLVATAAAAGLLTVAFELARSAWMAQHLAAGELPTRNAQLAAARSLTEAASFGAGGWIFQGLGGTLSLLADAFSYVISALCLWRVTDHRAAAPPSPWPRGAELLAEARRGIELLMQHRILRGLALLEILLALGMSLTATSYMIYVTRDLGFAPGALGMIFAVGGIGSAIGAGLAPRLGRLVGSRAAIVAGLCLLALGALCIPLAAGATLSAVLLLAAHQLIGDAGHVVAEVHDRTLRQSAAPPDALARVDAGLRTLGQATLLLGALACGALATALGARLALLLAATVFAGAALAARRALPADV
jgi:Na+/melibiose symporter-like transporter